jgi:hypothetical protein
MAFRIYLCYVTLTLKIETAVGTETLDNFQDVVQLNLESWNNEWYQLDATNVIYWCFSAVHVSGICAQHQEH